VNWRSGEQENRRTGEQENKRTREQENKRTREQENKRTREQENKSTGGQVIGEHRLEQYSASNDPNTGPHGSLGRSGLKEATLEFRKSPQ